VERGFKNNELGKIFEPKRDEVLENWRRLHTEELYDLYSSSNIIWVITSRSRWIGHVACMRKRRVFDGAT
jgi:hypothetical protein